MHKVIVLGAGRVGKVIARDLSEDEYHKVTVADRRAEYLDRIADSMDVETVSADLASRGVIRDTVAEFDLVIGALPGSLGFQAMKEVIEARKPCVDISFMPEDPRCLHDQAVASGAPILYDFGVAPGMSNLLAAMEALKLAPVQHVGIMVGGLPRQKKPPWEYVALFSPADVIEEYVRPARIRVGGKTVSRPALSGLEHVEFPGIGTLEAFHTDGLRSMLDTIDCPSMEEKTLRYPGHAGNMKLLKEAGFLDETPVELEQASVAPRDLTLRLLESGWRFDEDIDEFTVMRITVVGGAQSPYTRTVWNLLDHTDRARRETSMARTTGFPAAIAARRLLDGTLALEPGVHPPEAIARDGDFIILLLKDLEKRNVRYTRQSS